MANGLIAEWMHVVVAMFLAATIYAQMMLLRLPPGADCLQALRRVGRFNLSAILLTLTTGCARIYRSPRGLDWFAHSGYFHASLALFALTLAWSLLSIARVRRWQAVVAAGGLPDAAEWTRASRLANAQPLPLVIIALLMTLMAHQA